MKIIHWNFSFRCWLAIGQALSGESVTVQQFTLRGTNVADKNNLVYLFTGTRNKSEGSLEGLIKNRSIEILDLSDNDLNDDHSELILDLVKMQGV